MNCCSVLEDHTSIPIFDHLLRYYLKESFRSRLALTMGSSSLNSYVSNLISEINEAAKTLPSDPFPDDPARKRLQAVAQKLSGALETPMDTIRKMNYQVISLLLSAPSHSHISLI